MSPQPKNNSAKVQWSDVEKIFADAISLDPEERHQFVEDTCHGQPELSREVLSLLEAHKEAPDFLSNPPAAQMEAAVEDKFKQLAAGSFTFHPRTLGNYTLVRRLGVGGMAEIFQAVIAAESGLEKQIAIKSILPSLTSEHSLRELFENEARINSALTHSNIAQVYDFFSQGNNYFLSMEFVNGKNLRQVREKLKGQKIPQHMACYFMSEVAKGLTYAHNIESREHGVIKGIIHRDISPKNIMITYGGEVKIVDFGIAKAREKMAETRSITLKGTFRYMSPEQALTRKIDHRSDIFSAGLVLFELLTGETLFQATELVQTLDEVRQYPGVEPYLRGKNLPDPLENILRKSLAADPAQRYEDANDLHRDLQVFIAKKFSGSATQEASAWMTGLFSDEMKKEKAEVLESLGLSPVPFEPPRLRRPKAEEKVRTAPDLDAEKEEESEFDVNPPPPSARSIQPQKYDRLHDWKPETQVEKSSNWPIFLLALTMISGLAGFAYLNLSVRGRAPRFSKPVEKIETVESTQSMEAPPVAKAPEPVVALATPEPPPVRTEVPTSAPVKAAPVREAKRAAKSKVQTRIEAPLELTAPENEQQFYESDDSAGVTFSWSGRAAEKDKGQFYRLEISTEPSFGAIVGTFDVSGTTLSNARTKLDAGKYYWRVSLVDRSGARLEQTKEFAFTFHPRPRLMPPKSKMKIKSN